MGTFSLDAHPIPADWSACTTWEEPVITSIVESGSVVGEELDAADDRVGHGEARPAVVLFVVTSFLASSLLFLVQPMVAKMLLPSLGGTPSVWNTSMVFFQTALVAGYGLAHLGMRRLSQRRQRLVQVVALAVPVLALPVALPGGWEPPFEGSPAGWLLVALTVMVGGPFLMLSTSSPTLQYWFATGRGTRGRDPYFLYAAGNAGSLLALVAYPVIIEPNLDLEGQARLFSAGYLVLVLLSAVCAARREPTEIDLAGSHLEEPAQPVTWVDRRRWLAWSFVPSALLLGVTRHLTTDVMSVPMLWIAPLVLYLLTFIIAFGRAPARSVRIGSRGLQLVSIPLMITMLGVSTSLGLVIVVHLLGFFFAALLGHSRLAQSRPAPAHLTEFYLTISIGGAVGGAVTSLVAPVIFPTVIEYPLAIVAALAMCPGLVRRLAWKQPDLRTIASVLAVAIVLVLAVSVRGRGEPEQLAATALVLGLAAVVAFKAARSPKGFAAAMAIFLGVSILPATGTLVTDRSFFGVSTVKVDDQGIHQLLSGSTLHGLQDTDGDDPLRQLSYYTPAGPIGRYLTDGRPDRPLDVGILGLGSGALAGYGRTGDHLTYYEIDPAVVRIAQDPRYFSYLDKTPADVDIVLGDGRLTLRRSGASHDLLILDAFSSDAIPVHLLTREAFTEYFERIGPDGVIAVHISNRYFNLEPVLARLADDFALAGIVNRFQPTAEQHAADAAQPTNWVFLARDPGALAAAAAQPGWKPLDPDDAGPAWTDSFSNILEVLEPS